MLTLGKWLLAPWALLWSQRRLLAAMTRRDLAARYQGSVFGILWSLITPLLMLLVFGFVFTVVFEPRWPLSTGKGDFVMILFSGLLLFQFLSECITRAPSVISDHATFVKKVIFPVEILPGMVVLSAIVNTGISLAILLGGFLVLQGVPPVALLLLPAVLLPFAVLGAGIAWILASVGVYLRDVGQAMAILSTALMFLSGVFYPPQALPEEWRMLIYLSPATLPIEQARILLFEGVVPPWRPWLVYAVVAVLSASVGLSLFRKLRSGFADVV